MRHLDTLEPSFKPKILKLLELLLVDGITCIVTSGRRTIVEQNKLYAQGRTTPGRIVTKAKGGQSPHNFGLAADLCPLHPKTKKLWWTAPDDIWQLIALKAEGLGLVSGYNFKSIVDKPHVESSDWKLTQAKWKEGVIKVV